MGGRYVCRPLQAGNLCFIIDNNDLQIDGRVGEVSSPYPIDEKFRAFGFEVFCCDGHDFAALEETFQKVLNVTGKPAAIIAKTIKGKVSATWKTRWAGTQGPQ